MTVGLGNGASNPGRTDAPLGGALDALVRGSRLLTEPLARTFGPQGSAVIAMAPDGNGVPELLTKAGVIARRIVEVPEPRENIGMLIARHAVCVVHEEVGDGGAMTALLYERLLEEGSRQIAAGTDPVTLTDEIAEAAERVLSRLRAQVLPIDAEAAARALIQSMLDPELVDPVLEAAVAAGPEGFVDVRETYATIAHVEVVEGMRFAAHAAGGERPGRAIEFGASLVLVSADPLVDPAPLATLADRVLRGGHHRLVVVAPTVSESTDSWLRRTAGVIDLIVLETGPTVDAEMLDDLAASCGTRPLGRAVGDDLGSASLESLGEARRGWSGEDEACLVGVVDLERIRERIAARRAQVARAADVDDRIAARHRLAALHSTVAILSVPSGRTAPESRDRLGSVEAAARVAQLAAERGVVAGGGAVLVAASCGVGTDGARTLDRALSEPMRRIAARAGLEGVGLVERIRGVAAGTRFDVLEGRWVQPAEHVVLDSLAVLECVLRVAVSAACGALRTAAIVRGARPEMAVRP